MNKETSPEGRGLSWLTWLLIGMFGASLVLLGAVVYAGVRDYMANPPGSVLEDLSGGFEPLPTDTPDLVTTFDPGTPLPTLAPLTPPAETLPPLTPDIQSPNATPRPWNGKSRITVLVMGLDERYWKDQRGPYRSDSMILVTCDPITGQAGMLSIPRDLWVEIPGMGFNRINTAYYFGDLYQLPGGGGGLAKRTVEKLLGVPVDYYIAFNFAVFERMIDEVGGIDLDVPERVEIKAYGRDWRWVEVGQQHLDGKDALAYARVRKGAGDDFARTNRQREVAMAILRRVTSLNLLPSLITRAPSLYQELSASLTMDLRLDQLIELAWLAVQIPEENIRNGAIGARMVRSARSPDGWSVLMQIPDKIRELRNQIFVETSALGPSLPTLTP